MWTVVYMARNIEIAAIIKKILEKEGLLVKLKPVGKASEERDSYQEILVPQAEADEAHNIIIENGY